MATVGDAVDGRAVSVGRVLSRAFGVMGDNPVAVFGIAFVLGGLPQLAIGYVTGAANIETTSGAGLAAVGIASFVSVVAYLVLSALAQGALVRATVGYDAGERPAIGTCLATGLAVALPLIALSLLLGLGVMLASIVLIVPGIILYVMWSVAIPALVAERTGVFGAFGRSRALTRGVRWKVFGVGLLMLAIVLVMTAIVGILSALVAGPASMFTPGFNVVASLIGVVSSTLTTAFWSIVLTSLYVELRRAKDGPGDARLADIFS